MANKVRNYEVPENYKHCRKKMYDIHVCMPPKDTVVINKFEQADVVKMLNGKEYFTVAELERMQQNGDGRFNIITQALNAGKAYLVNDRTPFVLAGTMGELWTISPDKLASKYNFVTNNEVIPINQQTLQQRMTGNCLNWTVVRSVPDNSEAWACFVPLLQKGTVQTPWGAVLAFNAPGVPHGKGDFIIAQDAGGRPNLADRYVVNGEIFATTYNNHGWTDCLNQSTGIKNITIDSLPRLVPQQTASKDEGVDPNVFKQKCDTLMKELQKIYKFNVKSNTYETVKDYTGIAKEVEFNGDCYVAKYIVEGNFSHTYSVKDKATGSMTEKTVTATETDVWFGCSAVHGDSAISMTTKPRTDGFYLMGWAFPNNSDTKVSTEWRCRVGTIKDINCVEEVKLFKEKCNGRDVFIDNRKNSSEDYLNVIELVEAMSHSNVQGGIGIHHVLEEVYSNLSTDTISERAKLCHNIYNNLNIGYGSASLVFASHSEAVKPGSMIGTGVLSHKMNLNTLIKYLVNSCQQEEIKYDSLKFLYSLSETALSEAIMKLFYDTNNPNLSVLWKRLDLQYMFRNKIDLNIYNQSEYDINNRRVCIDFRLNGLKGIFVRCIFTATGSYAFEFLPKKAIAEQEVVARFSYDKDYDNYLGICKQLRDSCYMCLTELASETFRNNLPKYLISTDYEYLGQLGGKVGYFFKVISNNPDAYKSDYNRENNSYRIKFAVGSNETRVIYMHEDDAHTISVKCTLNGNTFEKSYKLSIKRNIIINAMLIFSDICKVLKIHPAKELLKSKRLWDNIAQTVSEKFSSGNHRKFNQVDARSKIDKITPVSINLGDTKYEILLRFYNNEKVIGERVLVVDFNYKNFDMRAVNSRSIKALGGLQNSNDIADMVFSMHYKYSTDTAKVADYTSSIDSGDIANEFYWATYELINSTKKYQA